MLIKYKQKCFKCKKNYVTITNRQAYTMCYDCQKPELSGKIKDPKMKKMFDIPEEFYKENVFLRNIKSAYLRIGELSDNQIDAFKKVVKAIKESKN
jgi:hypothetical protein